MLHRTLLYQLWAGMHAPRVTWRRQPSWPISRSSQRHQQEGIRQRRRLQKQAEVVDVVCKAANADRQHHAG
jgi:hypothetical protein